MTGAGLFYAQWEESEAVDLSLPGLLLFHCDRGIICVCQFGNFFLHDGKHLGDFGLEDISDQNVDQV